MIETLITIGIIVVAIVAIIIFLCSIYKVADIDKALIITGGKKPIIKVSGGALVIPIFRKAQYFDLCMLTVKADRDEIKTKTAVPIVADWTAQIRPDTSNEENLKKAIISFKERGQSGIINDVKLTLTGAVRDIVASMTPEAVLRDKAEFSLKVRETVEDEMKNMGMELVSLNIQDISDNNHYYANIAALDMEDKRLAAENKRADIDREVRKTRAESDRDASQNELEAKLAIAEKQRDNDLRRAEFKAETDKANADAAIAGKLQQTIRMQEIAEQEGQIEVVRQEQENRAAEKQREVIATRAAAEAERLKIVAEGDANVQRINADAEVLVAEKNANAIKTKAEALAEKTRMEGQANADVAKQRGLAEAEIARQRGLANAEVVKETGYAEAEIVKQRGLAEAEAERAKLMAQADGERALAEARASNEKVNFEIEKIKLENEARITIATKTAEVMAEFGKNAEFVNIGGSASGSGSGNAFFDAVGGIPTLMKMLNAQNQALNGQSFNDEVKGIVGSIAEPMKGLLVNTTPVTVDE